MARCTNRKILCAAFNRYKQKPPLKEVAHGLILDIDLTPEVVVDGMGDSLKERFRFCHELKHVRNE